MLRRILQHAVSTIPILYCIHRGCLESPPSNWNYDWILCLQNFPVPPMALQTSLHDEWIRYMWIMNSNSETYIWTVVLRKYNAVTTINILHYEGCTIHIFLRSEECACSTEVGKKMCNLKVVAWFQWNAWSTYGVMVVALYTATGESSLSWSFLNRGRQSS